MKWVNACWSSLTLLAKPKLSHHDGDTPDFHGAKLKTFETNIQTSATKWQWSCHDHIFNTKKLAALQESKHAPSMRERTHQHSWRRSYRYHFGFWRIRWRLPVMLAPCKHTSTRTKRTPRHSQRAGRRCTAGHSAPKPGKRGRQHNDMKFAQNDNTMMYVRKGSPSHGWNSSNSTGNREMFLNLWGTYFFNFFFYLSALRT